MSKHEHDFSEWVDDKPMNMQSQKELVILSYRRCLKSGCDKIQARIGRLKPKEKSIE